MIREPAVPFAWRGTEARTGAAEHALALEADWCRNACGVRQSVGVHDVARSLQNPMRTITSIPCTRDGAGLALRTSRADAIEYIHITGTFPEGPFPVSGDSMFPATTTPYEF